MPIVDPLAQRVVTAVRQQLRPQKSVGTVCKGEAEAVGDDREVPIQNIGTKPEPAMAL